MSSDLAQLLAHDIRRQLPAEANTIADVKVDGSSVVVTKTELGSRYSRLIIDCHGVDTLLVTSDGADTRRLSRNEAVADVMGYLSEAGLAGPDSQF